MLVEIPDPIVIVGVVLPIFVGLFSLFAYLKIRQISGFNAQNKADMERLEFYERQIIDMKIRLDAIDIENISNTPEIPRNFASFEQKIHESVPTTATREPKSVPMSTQPRRTPNMSLDNTVEVVLGLITDRTMTSRDIQITLGKSREHISRTMKKLFEDGYVERNMRTKPYSYSITQKGRGRLGLDQNPAPEMAPQTA
jgi:predicted HTH transcriptional regulator